MAVKVLRRNEHPISRQEIDSGALRVLSRLYRAGHTAYLVGGSVRDLFLERTPKDFDVVTSARPTQVRKLFRNCRLIGRRFRLAHVHFSENEIVEVATFRRQPDLTTEDDLLVISDNSFGSPEQDAYRRDFTINALFYCISNHSVIDYVGGVDDIEKRIVRTINDPWTRFQEDPVRMIRAIKFASKLRFKIEDKTWQALCESAPAISKSPSPRVQEEVARLVDEGASCDATSLLFKSGLLAYIEPDLNAYLTNRQEHSGWDPDGELLFDLLAAADEVCAEGRKVSRPSFFAIRLLPFLLAKGFLDSGSADVLVRKEVEKLLPSVGTSRREAERVSQILLALRRFRAAMNRSKRIAPRTFLTKSYFDEALLLYEIFLRALDEDTEHLEWWYKEQEKFQASRTRPQSLLSEPEREHKRVERSRRFRRRGGP